MAEPSIPISTNVAPLPPSYRFAPTDQELIERMRRKNENELYDHRDIGVLSFENFNPLEEEDSQPEYGDRISYYFAIWAVSGDQMTRCARGNGYWNREASVRFKIKNGAGDIIGSKERFIFYRGPVGNSTRTYWRMDEFHFPPACGPTNWVLCKVEKVDLIGQA